MNRPPTRHALFVALLVPASLAAQPSFVEVTPVDDPHFTTPPAEDFWINAVSAADVDLDGDLDLAVLGFHVVYFESVEDRLSLLLNTGPDAGGGWTFTSQAVPLGDLVAGASDLAWGDFDGDGDHDLVVASEGATVVYRNDAGILSPLANVLPGYFEDSSYTNAYDLRSVTWADYDNDGDPDLLIPSVFDFDLLEYRTALVRNDGDGGGGSWLFTEVAASFAPTVHAQSAWADADADGDLDLFLANVDPYTETGFVHRYRNDGAGAFTSESLVPIEVQYGLADWGDMDADGDLDLLVAGNIQEADETFTTVLRVYRDDGGVFTPSDLVTAPSAEWLDLHAATWADYDSDGDIDLLATGNFIGATEIEGKSEIFGNEGGVFAPLGVALPAPVESIGRGGAFLWLDLDGDADLDYLVAGAYSVEDGGGLVESEMHLYRNATTSLNLRPGTPAGAASLVGADAVALTWSAASDDHTAAPALTYDLEIHPIGAPLAGADRLPEPGNLGAVVEWNVAGLPEGLYAWSVRAVDSAFAGGTRAGGGFSIPDGRLIFYDAFESGDRGAWSAGTP